MRSKKLNQKMTLLTLVVALGVAVYLNWEYAKSTDLALDAAEANAPVTTTGVVTDALAVDGDVETGDKNYGEAQLVSVGDTLQKSLKSAKLSDEEKDALTAQLTAAIDSITAESDIETLVKAKGFVDCVAFINGDAVDVTVMTTSDGLTKEEVAQIRDIVLSKCQVTAQNITIVEVK